MALVQTFSLLFNYFIDMISTQLPIEAMTFHIEKEIQGVCW